MPSTLDDPEIRACFDSLVRALRPLDIDGRQEVLNCLAATLRKPRVRQDHTSSRQGFRVDIGAIAGCRRVSWTHAVRYAKEWHRNVNRSQA
jgi:hypothetical protein